MDTQPIVEYLGQIEKVGTRQAIRESSGMMSVAGIMLLAFTAMALEMLPIGAVRLLAFAMLTLVALAIAAKVAIVDWRVDNLRQLLSSTNLELQELEDNQFRANNEDGANRKGYLVRKSSTVWDVWLVHA